MFGFPCCYSSVKLCFCSSFLFTFTWTALVYSKWHKCMQHAPVYMRVNIFRFGLIEEEQLGSLYFVAKIDYLFIWHLTIKHKIKVFVYVDIALSLTWTHFCHWFPLSGTTQSPSPTSVPTAPSPLPTQATWPNTCASTQAWNPTPAPWPLHGEKERLGRFTY